MVERVSPTGGVAYGHCVFGTWKGIQAKGSGVLTRIGRSLDLLEFRHILGEDWLKDSEQVGYFRRVLIGASNGERYDLIGAVQGGYDAVGRVGFTGAATAVEFLGRSAYAMALDSALDSLRASYGKSPNEWQVQEVDSEWRCRPESGTPENGPAQEDWAMPNDRVPLVLHTHPALDATTELVSEVLAQITWVESGYDQTVVVVTKPLRSSVAADWSLVKEIRSIKEAEISHAKKRLAAKYHERIRALEAQLETAREQCNRLETEVERERNRVQPDEAPRLGLSETATLGESGTDGAGAPGVTRAGGDAHIGRRPHKGGGRRYPVASGHTRRRTRMHTIISILLILIGAVLVVVGVIRLI